MKTLFISIALFLFLSAGYAHAQTQTASQFCTGGSCTYVPLEPLPGLPDCYGPNPPSTCKNPSGSFAGLIGNSFKLLIGAGALIAIIMIVLGALTYMFSDIAGNKKNALDRIRNAIWAVVLLVSSYLILFTINPDLVQFNLNLNPSGNFTTSPNLSGSTPAQTQLTPQEAQAAQNSCNQRCSPSGGSLHSSTNGTYSCSCIPTAPL